MSYDPLIREMIEAELVQRENTPRNIAQTYHVTLDTVKRWKAELIAAGRLAPERSSPRRTSLYARPDAPLPPASLHTRMLACAACGQPFPYRYDNWRELEAYVERLCLPCFDAYCRDWLIQRLDTQDAGRDEGADADA